uniref:Uncharacterized protein n=1 Tax=Acrobeloides nanus TaxID=290746 RepID=A0A914DK53_9BILA
MGDRASTQELFAKLFAETKMEFAQVFAEGWTEEQKKEALKLIVLHCQVHILQNATTHVLAELVEFEKLEGINEGKEPLVMEILKLATSLISERSGPRGPVYDQWLTFSKENGINEPVLPSLKGHRFNIVFDISERLFKMRSDLMEFFDFSLLYKTNPTVATLYELLQNPFIFEELRILALINISLTTVLWSISEWSKNISNTAECIQELNGWIMQILKSPELLYETKLHPFNGNVENMDIKSYDERMEKIFEEEFTPDFITLLALTFQCFSTHIEHHFRPFIEDSELTKEANKKEGILNNNVLCESAFAFLDYLHFSRPHMSFLRREALTILKKNKTMQYYRGLHIEEQKQLLHDCKKDTKIFLQDFESQMKNLQQQKLEKLKNEREERLCKLEIEKELVESTTNEMAEKGFWTSTTNINEKLRNMSNDVQRYEELVFQLKFRKNILQQKAKSSMFSLSKKNKKLTVEELKTNLMQLIAEDVNIPKVNDRMVGKNFVHRFLTESSIPSAEADGFEEDEGKMYDLFKGKIVSAIRVSPITPIIYLLQYKKYPNSLYAWHKDEFSKDVMETTIVIEEKEKEFLKDEEIPILDEDEVEKLMEDAEELEKSDIEMQIISETELN